MPVKCPRCGADVPESDYICSDCGGYVPRDLTAGDATAPTAGDATAPTAGDATAPTSPPSDDYPPLRGWPGIGRLDVVESSRARDSSPGDSAVDLEEERRLRGRRMAFWSMGFAALAFLVPAIFGPIGVVTGYFAFRAGETRLGAFAVALSAVAMLVGITAGILAAS